MTINMKTENGNVKVDGNDAKDCSNNHIEQKQTMNAALIGVGWRSCVLEIESGRVKCCQCCWVFGGRVGQNMGRG